MAEVEVAAAADSICSEVVADFTTMAPRGRSPRARMRRFRRTAGGTPRLAEENSASQTDFSASKVSVLSITTVFYVG